MLSKCGTAQYKVPEVGEVDPSSGIPFKDAAQNDLELGRQR